MTAGLDYTRLYVGPYSRVSHLAYGPNVYDCYTTVCGKHTDRFWFGTGSQDEYDHAAALPLCHGCAEVKP